MKRLLMTMALAMGMSVLMLGIASAQDTGYYVAYGEFNSEAGDGPEIQAAMMGHIEYLNKLYAEGKLFMGGPFGNGDSGILIFKASSLEEVREWLQADPSIAAGVIKPVFLREWHAMMSRPDNRSISLEEFRAMWESGGPQGEAASGDMQEAAEEWMPEVGSPMFLQIPSSDAAASGEFYNSLFGWTITTMEAEGEPMNFFNAPGGMMGEFSQMTQPAPAMTGVTFFVTTESVTAMLPRVEAAGGTVIQPLMKLPEDWGHIAIIGDPSGNAVGLWSAGE